MGVLLFGSAEHERSGGHLRAIKPSTCDPPLAAALRPA
jgi:hypothetical protein